ncbi:MAG: DUF1987 domain-containing protein [Bacteroidia bacterium]|nr:DUF1987 domain-containing protein [Bacteroidia bacterium]
MENLNITATEFTPEVILNHEKNLIEFSGESRPENINLFFIPINEWIEQYVNYVFYADSITDKDIIITVNFKFEYFNSSTAKRLLEVLRKLIVVKNNSKKINLLINWYYDDEDEDMLDTGKEYEKMVNHQFNFIQN